MFLNTRLRCWAEEKAQKKAMDAIESLVDIRSSIAVCAPAELDRPEIC